ncbi:hypothetical protein F4819DRAFT_501525 [Hypoxylon fuscum]|nr:hypothetical protein F4819DRAFT_501525 [Hypoxylon fuscum]
MSNSNPFSSLFNQQNLTARLAVLQPAADRDAPIELNLTEAPLKETSYECISYDRSAAAAAKSNPVTILVNGEEQTISESLDSALRTFRRKERPRTLWADLLVGRTIEERSAQASMQRHVLENAERTLCWLGQDKGEATAKAFETIHEMGRRFSEACSQVGIGPDQSLTRVNMQQMAGLREKLMDCPYNDLHSFDFAHWAVIYDVFGASYWTSVQSISDIVLARAPVVVCGRSNIRWHAYVAASRALPFYQAKFFQVPFLPHVERGFEIANSIEIAERRRRLSESVELFPMIQTARDCHPADPRENVFSMLLIATPSARLQYHNAGAQALPAIDYGKSVQEVFTEAARYTVLERQDLMLWYGERPPCARRVKGLPTWVPDFSAGAPKGSAHCSPNTGMRAWWDHIQPPSARKPLTVSTLADGTLALHTQARPLDRVVHVSPVFNAGNARRLCYAEFKNLPSAPTAETADRFWRTLVLNTGGDRGASASLRDNAAPAAGMAEHFASILAEESILGALGCSTVSELQTPENAARMQSAPELMAMVPQCGKAAPYEELLEKYAAGRRFFRTEEGRFGMTAVEDVVAADNSLLGEEPKPETADADLGRLMNDPISRSMMQSFQEYLNERDPAAAQVAAKAMRGEIPGLSDGNRKRTDGGVQEGDIVVACVGGFYPYILRPRSQQEGAEAGASEGEGERNPQPSEEAASSDSSTYEFVGDCYLHGAMEGEDFQAKGYFGRTQFKIDVSKLVDITIV